MAEKEKNTKLAEKKVLLTTPPEKQEDWGDYFDGSKAIIPRDLVRDKHDSIMGLETPSELK